MLRLPSADFARRRWADAKPFPHLVYENALWPEDSTAIGAEFPPPDSGDWHTFTGPLEAGKQEADAHVAGPEVARLHAELASDGFVAWLSQVSGVPDLVADPARKGGGIHQCAPGGRLGVHTDFNLHPDEPSLLRAVNVIVFVGSTFAWRREWEGHLYLGRPDRYLEGSELRDPVAPEGGTFVAFEASDTSWHGHPFPMADDAPLRRSVPAYYYRPLAPDEHVKAHSTVFLEGP